uniref:Uncharacterized protein n=1 Tax=Timema bartmani TaxID=61472 RepID=A0A7R9I820_9NEOP|nr:unnamed protein product [Timema bartmani]
MAPSRVDDVILKPLDKRIGGTVKSVVKGLRQLLEVVLDSRHIQVVVQSHIPNIPRCIPNDPQTHALESLHPPHTYRPGGPKRDTHSRGLSLGTVQSPGLLGVQRKSQVLNTVRPSDLLSKQPEWGRSVELSFPCEEHCGALLHGPVLYAQALNLVLPDIVPVLLDHLANRMDFVAPVGFVHRVLRDLPSPPQPIFLPDVPEDRIGQINLWRPLRMVPRRRSFKRPLDGGSYELRTAIDFCCCSKGRGGSQPLSQHIRELVPVSALKRLQHQPPFDPSGDNEVEDVRETKGIVREVGPFGPETAVPPLPTSPDWSVRWQMNYANENLIAERKWVSTNSITLTRCFARKLSSSAFFPATPLAFQSATVSFFSTGGPLFRCTTMRDQVEDDVLHDQVATVTPRRLLDLPQETR